MPNNHTKTYADIESIHIHKDDNIAVALSSLEKGKAPSGPSNQVFLINDVPRGHKFALKNINSGTSIYKYGVSVGVAIADIHAGEHVHTHNMKTSLSGITEYSYQPAVQINVTQPPSPLVFMGYERSNGDIATRNEIWVLSTVGCVALISQRLALKANIKFGGRCDGIHAFTHPFGCSQTGGDLSSTRNLMASLASHPNAGGILIVGLGCENNQGKALLEAIPEEHHHRIRFFNCQDSGDEFEDGMRHLDDLSRLIKNDKRTPQGISKLILGMKCGGSDGLSGLTANSLLGRVSDIVCANNGRVVLTEIPEMFGAEHILMNRAQNRDIFQDIVTLINGFKQYYLDHGENVYENPSPGNKQGGITTLEEKSMGAIQKGGQTIVTDVIDYAERVTKCGLTLLRGPGNDAVSSTNLVASGANLILFTTGRGTPLGFPVPTIKISSNSTLAINKENWIDFNAGILVEGYSPKQATDDLLNDIISFASGENLTKSEINEQREIAIWKRGVTL